MFLQNANIPSRILEDSTKVKDVTWQSINNILTSIIERLPYLLAGLLVILIFWLIAKAIKKVFLSVSGKTRLDGRLRTLFSRLIVVLVTIIGIFTSLTVIIPDFRFGDLITGLGFTTFVIGFATKDILNNLLSGILILWQQPFSIGDYIFAGSNEGKVEYIGIRATQLRKSDGELVLIPNGDMYSNAITIRGAGAERRMILTVNISYDADIGHSKKTAINVLETTDGVVTEPKPSVVVTDLSVNGVNLSICFWIDTNEHSATQVFDEVATRIKKSLEDAEIKMFPPSSISVLTSANGEYSTEKLETKN